MSLLEGFRNVVAKMERGVYFDGLCNRPAPHRLRTAPQVAFNTGTKGPQAQQAIVIPTFNHEECIADNLNCLLGSISVPSQIVLIDDASEDRTVEAAKSALVHSSMPADDPKQRQPDIAAAKRAFDWEPTVPLREGLKRTIDYFREVVSSGR